MRAEESKFNLERFVQAQNPIYKTVLQELRQGRKLTHWMWFIFPQIKGLGFFEMAQYYGIDSKEEALSYICHPLLGPRLTECTYLVLAHKDRSASEVFGYPDDLKFRSCMTLFSLVAKPDKPFQTAIGQFFGGEPDRRTIEIMESVEGNSSTDAKPMG